MLAVWGLLLILVRVVSDLFFGGVNVCLLCGCSIDVVFVFDVVQFIFLGDEFSFLQMNVGGSSEYLCT